MCTALSSRSNMAARFIKRLKETQHEVSALSLTSQRPDIIVRIGKVHLAEYGTREVSKHILKSKGMSESLSYFHVQTFVTLFKRFDPKRGTVWPWRWHGTSYSISSWRDGLRNRVPSTKGNCSNTGSARWHSAQLTTFLWLALRADRINLQDDGDKIRVRDTLGCSCRFM